MKRNHRFAWIALLGGMICALPAASLALDINLLQNADALEAKQFFQDLAEHSKNPFIVSMAQESLQRIKKEQAESAPVTTPTKKTAEIALLPQTDNTFVVPAMVNNRYMATFLVDTGASYTVITPQLAKQLGIEPKDYGDTLPVTTANGTLNAPVVKLRNVNLGGIQVNEVDAVVTDLGDSPQLSGLLGMSFFRGMELSFKQDKLVISR